jgi:YesN/AraC family two-component response regulator
MEIMYAYKGSCEVLLVDERISLNEGNLLIIDKRTCHRVEEVKKGNIILNLVIKKDYLTKHLLNRLSKNSLITHFMLQSIKNKKFEKSYLMFLTKKQDEPVNLLDRILLEYYNLREFSEEIIDSYMALFFIELIRGKFIEKATKPESKTADKYTTIDFLQYIERNYQQDSLNNMAAHFNYHPNYLSNRLKSETGKSYMELLQLQKMTIATVLLSSTNLSVEEIVAEIGYSSVSFFYKKFKDFHGETPQKFRANL